MAIETYTKAAYSGLTILPYTGSNIDAIVTLAGAANVSFALGYLDVFGERINVGDAVAVTTDEPPVAAPKKPASELHADAYQVQAIVYDETNIVEIIAFAGAQNVTYRAETLMVGGVVVAADLAANYTAEE
ncbi:MAG: hypothetical protein ACREJC_22455 [Tepidisphaeraceae bacterium]